MHGISQEEIPSRACADCLMLDMKIDVSFLVE